MIRVIKRKANQKHPDVLCDTINDFNRFKVEIFDKNKIKFLKVYIKEIKAEVIYFEEDGYYEWGCTKNCIENNVVPLRFKELSEHK